MVPGSDAPCVRHQEFDISAILPLAILFLVNSIQAMGDFSATTTGGMDRLPTDEELNGGIIGYGVSNIE